MWRCSTARLTSTTWTISPVPAAICCLLLWLLAWLLPVGARAASAVPDGPVVVTRQGAVQGIASSRAARVFWGIPYATPPVGRLRWRAPQPPQPWDTVRLCSRRPPVPWQMAWAKKNSFYALEYHDTVPRRVSEDCLYLNVWLPRQLPCRQLPVMVWVHGGAFWSGHSTAPEFMGDSLAARGVMVVTVGYRLGTAGFLAHDSLAREAGTPGSGNYGIMDVIAALRWVRDNATAFGGDTTRVTLFGESAGAGIVQALLGSPLARGLFHRAILQSGGGYKNIIFPVSKRLSQGFARGMMRYGHIPGIDSLRHMPIHAVDSLALRYAKRRLKIPYVWPTMDGWVIPHSFGQAMRDTLEAPVPHIIGYTRNDLAKPIMRRSAHRWARRENELGNRTWVYSFDRDMPGNRLRKNGSSGAFHTAENRFVFGTLAGSWRPWRQADYQLSRLMVSYWTNFAKTGDPNGPGLPRWEVYTGKKQQVMHFDVPAGTR